MIAIHHCAKEQLAWLDVVQIRAPLCTGWFFRWSSPEKGENLTVSASSTPNFMFEYTSPHKLGLVYSNMNSGVLEAESVKFSPFSAKCTLCSFNSSTPEFMFKYTSPRKLGLVYLNMNSGVLEPDSVKFFPFHENFIYSYIWWNFTNISLKFGNFILT